MNPSPGPSETFEGDETALIKTLFGGTMRDVVLRERSRCADCDFCVGVE